MKLPNRILVYGTTGSGKSTLANRLSEITSIPWTEVDTLTWEPGWVEVPRETQRQKVTEICAGDQWILDSAYGKWLDIPLGRVELIVGLDFARHVSLLRLMRRTALRVLFKRPSCNGNIEQLRKVLSRDSIILWHFKSYDSKKRRLHTWANRESGPKTILFKSPAELEAWLETLIPLPKN